MVRSRMAVRRRHRPRSRLHWAGLTVAPWCLAVGLIVSFVADAGQDAVIGATRMDLTELAAVMPSDLVPSERGADAVDRLPFEDHLLHEARLVVGDTDEIEAAPDEIEPKTTLKASSRDFPAIDRTNRGDPLVQLRPTFDTRLRRPGSLDAYRVSDVAFSDGDPTAPPIVFGELDGGMPELGQLGPCPRN